MIKKFIKYIFNYNKNITKLGRWNLKSCNNNKTIIIIIIIIIVYRFSY